MDGRTSRKAGTLFDLLQKYAIILSEIKFRRVLNLTYYKRFFEELQQDLRPLLTGVAFLRCFA